MAQCKIARIDLSGIFADMFHKDIFLWYTQLRNNACLLTLYSCIARNL